MIRLTGMSSGLDTEAMITELMSAYKGTKQKKVSAMTKYSWKMDTWSSLNKKIQNFYSKALSNMKFSTTFKAKSTKVSDTTKASVTASNSAVSGSQTLAIKQLAQAGYLTGGKLSTKDGSALSSSTTLSQLGYSEGDTSIDINGKTININGDTTIKDVVSGLQDAGLNASFDAKNSRIFVSSKNMGAANDFSITGNDTNGIKALANLGLYTGVTASSASQNGEYAKYVDAYTDSEGKLSFMLNDSAKDVVSNLAMDKLTAYQNNANKAKDVLDKNDYYKNAAQEATDAGKSDEEFYSYISDSLKSQTDSVKEELDTVKEDLGNINKQLDRHAELSKKKEEDLTEEEKTELAAIDADALKEQKETLTAQEKELTDKQASLKEATENLASYQSNTEKATAANCAEEASKEVLGKATAAYKAANAGSDAELSAYVANSASASAVRIDGKDAVIFLNGAEFTAEKNSFDINGLTITCTDTTELTAAGKAKQDAGIATTAEDYNTITLTTDTDVDGIYDTVKNFIKEYNSLIKEMDTLYNAESSKDYDVLTDEQKDAMSDTEAEAWEKKIKDSLLRRDGNLSSVVNLLKQGMQSTYEYNGKNYALSTFGINTLSYFSAPDNEKGVYHIDGDSDDPDSSSKDDLLKAAIANDPEAVTSFFTSLAQDMYKKMTTLSGTSTGRSFGNFYDDKTMKSQYSTYKNALADYEKKLNGIEDKYYKQFSAMEVALSKLQSSTSSLTSLFGTQ